MKTNKTAQHTSLLIAAVLFAVSIGYHAQLGSINYGMDKEDYYVHYNIKNTGTENLNDGTISLWIPDLDFRAYSNNFNLKKSNMHSGFIFPLEEYSGKIKPGEYLTRVKYANDKTSAAQWIWLWVE